MATLFVISKKQLYIYKISHYKSQFFFMLKKTTRKIEKCRYHLVRICYPKTPSKTPILLYVSKKLFLGKKIKYHCKPLLMPIEFFFAILKI